MVTRPGDGSCAAGGADLRERAAAASLALAALLVVLKLAAAIATGSLAVLSSLLDSLADIGASAITYLSVRVSRQPPDRGHRFGHGKAESLSALAQSAMVGGSALFVLVDACRRVVEPAPVRSPEVGVAVMAFAIVATLALVTYQRRVVRLTGSRAIAADRLHYTADLATNLSVLVSLLLVARTGICEEREIRACWHVTLPLAGLNSRSGTFTEARRFFPSKSSTAPSGVSVSRPSLSP